MVAERIENSAKLEDTCLTFVKKYKALSPLYVDSCAFNYWLMYRISAAKVLSAMEVKSKATMLAFKSRKYSGFCILIFM